MMATYTPDRARAIASVNSGAKKGLVKRGSALKPRHAMMSVRLSSSAGTTTALRAMVASLQQGGAGCDRFLGRLHRGAYEQMAGQQIGAENAAGRDMVSPNFNPTADVGREPAAGQLVQVWRACEHHRIAAVSRGLDDSGI